MEEGGKELIGGIIGMKKIDVKNMNIMESIMNAAKEQNVEQNMEGPIAMSKRLSYQMYGWVKHS